MDATFLVNNSCLAVMLCFKNLGCLTWVVFGDVSFEVGCYTQTYITFPTVFAVEALLSNTIEIVQCILAYYVMSSKPDPRGSKRTVSF